MSKALVLDVVDVRPQLYCVEARLLKTDANTPSEGESCTDRLASDLFSNLTCLTCLNEPAPAARRQPGTRTGCCATVGGEWCHMRIQGWPEFGIELGNAMWYRQLCIAPLPFRSRVRGSAPAG
jgi:hypothetical protein